MGDFAMQLGARMPRALRGPAYQAQQRGMLYPIIWTHSLLRRLAKMRAAPNPEAEAEVQLRYDALLARDLSNVEQGHYPKELLFQIPFVDYLKRAPMILRDLPSQYRRRQAGNYKDLPDSVDAKRYPPYFRRTFHWQTDGYLSRKSADRYDPSVEFLFLGTADVMRRQVIPPISEAARSLTGEVRLLDVACGTGRTLRQLATARPKFRYYGLDLSPFYLQHARDLLSDVEHLSLAAENAESMPYRDDFFNFVTSVHLFHELPRPARRNVYREMFRVLEPGGTLVIQDSAQQSESERLSYFLGRFSVDFHEPFHQDYATDDIATALEECGFVDVVTERCFVSKNVIARKPRQPRQPSRA